MAGQLGGQQNSGKLFLARLDLYPLTYQKNSWGKDPMVAMIG